MTSLLRILSAFLIGKTGELTAAENTGQVFVLGLFPLLKIRLYNNAPEIFWFQFIVVTRLDKNTGNGTALLKMDINGIIFTLPVLNKFYNSICSHYKNVLNWIKREGTIAPPLIKDLFSDADYQRLFELE